MQIRIHNYNKDLILGVEMNNTNTLHFYKNLGFVDDPTLEHDYILDESHSMKVIYKLYRYAL